MRISLQLGLAFLATVLVVAGGALYSLEALKGALRATTEEEVRHLAEGAMADIDAHLVEHTRHLHALSASLRLAAVAAAAGEAKAAWPDRDARIGAVDGAWDGGGEPPELDAALRSPTADSLRAYMDALEAAAGVRPFSEMYVTDRYGTVIATSGRTSDYLQADEPWYAAALAADGVWIGGVEYDVSSGAYSNDIVLPLHDPQGRFTGIFKAVLDVDDIRAIIARLQPALGFESLSLALVDRRGSPIFSALPAGGAVAEDVKLREFAEPIPGWPRIVAAFGGDAGATLLDLGAGGRLVAYAPSRGGGVLPGLGWSIVATAAPDEVFAAVGQARFRLIAGMLSGLLVAGVVGGAITRSVARRLARMGEAARCIGQGDLSARVAVGGADEFGRLAASLNAMARELQLATVSKYYVDSILGRMSDILLLLGEDGRIEVINPAACTLLGYRCEELTGEPVSRICPHTFLDDPPLRRLVMAGRIPSLEQTCRTRDGREVPVLFSVSVLSGPDSDLQGVMLVGIDIRRRIGATDGELGGVG